MTTDDSGKVMTHSCEEHGQLHEAVVYCQHDAEAETRRVMDAHRATYGGNCTAGVTIKLLDPAGTPLVSKHTVA